MCQIEMKECTEKLEDAFYLDNGRFVQIEFDLHYLHSVDYLSPPNFRPSNDIEYLNLRCLKGKSKNTPETDETISEVGTRLFKHLPCYLEKLEARVNQLYLSLNKSFIICAPSKSNGIAYSSNINHVFSQNKSGRDCAFNQDKWNNISFLDGVDIPMDIESIIIVDDTVSTNRTINICANKIRDRIGKSSLPVIVVAFLHAKPSRIRNHNTASMLKTKQLA